MPVENLLVFQKAYKLAMDVYGLSKGFPKEEMYSLTGQIRRSSRSICANIAEAYRKKVYPKSFIAKLVDVDGECSETLVHLMFARDCKYIDEETYNQLKNGYVEVGKMLGAIIRKPENIINY